MRALILGGSNGAETAPSRDAAAEYLVAKGHEVEVVPLKDKDIAGRFGCRLKTPGSAS